MRNFCFDICDIEKIVKDRFKVSPVSIEPWINQVIINCNAVSNQNDRYTWRFDKPVQINGVVTASKEFPFFIGYMDINVYNPDPVGVSVANAYLLMNNFALDAMDGVFYDYTADQILRFGIGAFAGEAFPNSAINLDLNKVRNPHFIISPFTDVQLFTDGTGAIYLTIALKFAGYRVYIT